MLRVVLEERKRREVDPTLRVLKECLDEAKRGGPADARTRERLGSLLEFFETAEASYKHLSGMPMAAFRKFLQIGRGFKRLVGRGR
jgi:hypothetical protein